MRIIIGSHCFQWILRIINCLIGLYEHSKIKRVVDRLGNVWKNSHFGSLGSTYERQQPCFENSVIGSGIHRILVFVFGKINFPKFLKSRLGQYEVMTYILALYAIVDCIFRRYIASFASVWDELFLILMFGIWLVKGIQCKEEACKRTPMDYCVVVFAGVFFVLMLFSPSIVIAIEGFRVLVQYILWYFAVVQLLKDKVDAKNLLMIFTCMVGILAIHGVYQYIVGVEMPETWVESSENIRTRVYSIFTSPNIFGSLLVLATPITVSMIMIEKKIRRKLFYSVLCVCMLGALVFTYSRGAWLGLACAIGVYVLLKDKRLIIPAVIGAILVLIFVPSISNRLLFMFSGDYISSSLRGGRLIRWITALQILEEHPLTGLGLGQFGGAVAMNHGLSAIVKGESVATFYMDNNYLKIAAESGIIGLGIFVWLMYQVITVSIKTIGVTTDKTMKEMEIGILAGLSGVIFHNLVENVFEVPMMVSMFWMLVAVMMHFWYLNYDSLKEKRK